MAKIKFGLVVTDARGKLGGHVFSKNRAGGYIRTKVTPVNPQSAAQSVVRQSFGQISQSWSGLTEAQRGSFNEAVSSWSRTNIFGDLKNPTGKNLFTRLNQNLVLAGFSQLVSVPTKLEMPSVSITGVAIDTAAETISVYSFPSTGSFKVIVNATPPMTQGTSFFKNKFRKIATLSTGVLDNEALFDAYVSKFGTPGIGQNIRFSFKYVLQTGQVTTSVVKKVTFG